MPPVEEKKVRFAELMKEVVSLSNEIIKEKAFSGVASETEEEFFDPFADVTDDFSELDKHNDEYQTLLESALTEDEEALVIQKLEDSKTDKGDAIEWAEFAIGIGRIAKKILLA